ncbi:PLP-dependent aminotransferase family protein [Thiobacillus sp.]|uniref:aminotransferase-like domain-containing protein n=1 Tax=Thiobacillus sp. TaxID=924 RepID=UPI0011D7CB84|nr:PLP-dependent aminotransferase family protein [Thiobacillus sp.]TXH76842.1 MAG: PLP-dependent aminotransferase family protein [Thiobacillus sp.]
MNLYEELAERLKAGIRQGLYAPGQKVPSVRRFSTQQQASAATVVAAYRLLEAQGWLEAKPQSGYFVCLPDALPPRATQTCEDAAPCQVNVSGLAVQLYQATQREGLISLGAAVPHPELLPTRDLREATSRAMRRSSEASCRYSFPPGEKSLRLQIARRGAEAGCAFDPEEIQVTCGTQESIHLALRAIARPGDVVAIESPAFFGTLQAIESMGLQALEVPCDGDGISLEALAMALERWPIKAVLVVANFSNPSGSLMPDARKRQLVKMLAERDIPLVEDDIYGDLAHDRIRPHAIKAYDTTSNVLYCGSFSKTLAPGCRVGWLVPGRWGQEVSQLKYVSSMATATLPQLALAEYLVSGRYERHLVRLRRTVESNLLRAQTLIARHFPHDTRVSRPQGGFLLWVQMPQDCDAMRLYQAAINEGISISPGPLFSPQEKFRNCFRLSVALPWDSRVDNALARLGQLVGSQAIQSPA